MSKLRTKKQREIVSLVCTMNELGHPVRYEDFFEFLSYGRNLSRQTLICSTRILIQKGFLRRTNNEKNEASFYATEMAMAQFKPRTDLSHPEPHFD